MANNAKESYQRRIEDNNNTSNKHGVPIEKKVANVCKTAIQEVLTSVDHLDLGEMTISITLKDLRIDSKSERR